MFVYLLSYNLVHLLLLVPRGQEGNSDPVIGRAIKPLSLLVDFCTCSFQFNKLYFACFLVLFFSQTRKESKSRYRASNKDHFCCFVVHFLLLTVFWQGFWTWGSGYHSTVSKSMLGECQAGSVGGPTTQQGTTRTPRQSGQPGGITPPGSGATTASRHRHKGQTVILRGNPEGQ